MAKRIIVVAGATGSQGGSVVKALANTNYEIRALTRNTSKPAAQSLLKLGSNIHLQQCDLTDESSLKEALKDAYGFYSVTDYFAHKLEKVEDVKEEEEGKFQADIAKASGIEHYIYSSLPETREYSGGKYQNIYHFDGKHRVELHARKLGFPITSFVAPSCYAQNFIGPGTRADSDGTVVFAMPFRSLDSTFPITDVEHDLGAVVKAVFDQGSKANGKLFPVVGQFIRASDIAGDFEKVTGRKARFDLIPKNSYMEIVGPRMGEFVATDLWEMFDFFNAYGFGAAGEPEALNNTKELGVHLNTWVDFLKRTGWTGPK